MKVHAGISRLQSILYWAIVLASAGCSSAEPKLFRITGKVSIDGVPASGVIIGFWPADPKTDMRFHSGYARADEEGGFTLGDGIDSGLGAGEYKVTFSRIVRPDGSPTREGKLNEKGARESLPAKYLNREDTPESVHVNEGTNVFHFDLKRH